MSRGSALLAKWWLNLRWWWLTRKPREGRVLSFHELLEAHARDWEDLS